MKNHLEYKGYHGTVNFNEEDNVLFGKIIGINDLVNYEAESVGELRDAFAEAVDDYLETCLEFGKEPNKHFKGVFNVRAGSPRHSVLALIAAKKQMKLNELVNVAFDYLINNEDKVLKQQ